MSSAPSLDLPAWVHFIAKRYDISVRISSSREDGFVLSKGPRGHWCDPAQRLVVVDPTCYYPTEPETLHHEMMHVIVQPPWDSIDRVTEDFILMQFERCMARALLARGLFEKKEYLSIVEWQEMTVSGATDEELGDYPNYQQCSHWKNGFAMCREIGLLTQSNQPTWRSPDWSILSDRMWRRVHEAHRGETVSGNTIEMVRKAVRQRRVQVASGVS